MRRCEGRFAGQNPHLSLLGHLRQPRGESTNNFAFPGAQSFEIDLWVGERYTAIGEMRRFIDDLGGVQQRLGGNAADVQTDATERGVALDQDDGESEVGGAEG